MAHKELSMLELLEHMTTAKDLPQDEALTSDNSVKETKSHFKGVNTIKVTDISSWPMNYSSPPIAGFKSMNYGHGGKSIVYKSINYHHKSPADPAFNPSSQNRPVIKEDTDLLAPNVSYKHPIVLYPNLKYPNPVSANSSGWNATSSSNEEKVFPALQPPPDPPKLLFFRKETSPDYRTHKANILKRQQSPQLRPNTPPLVMGPRTPPMPPPKTPPMGPRTPPQSRNEARVGPHTPPPINDESHICTESSISQSTIDNESHSNTVQNDMNGPRTPPTFDLSNSGVKKAVCFVIGPKTPPLVCPPLLLERLSNSPLSDNVQNGPQSLSLQDSSVQNGPKTPSLLDQSIRNGPKTPPMLDNDSPVEECESPIEESHLRVDDCQSSVCPSSPVPVKFTIKGRAKIKLLRRRSQENSDSGSNSSSSTPDTFYPDYIRKLEDSPERPQFPLIDSSKSNVVTSVKNNVSEFFLKDPFLLKDLGDGLNKNIFIKNSETEPTLKQDQDLVSEMSQVKLSTSNVKQESIVVSKTGVQDSSDNDDSGSSNSNNTSSLSIDIEPGEYISDSDVNAVENEDDPFIKYSDYEELLNLEKERVIEDEVIHNDSVNEQDSAGENGSPVLYDMSDTESDASSKSSNSGTSPCSSSSGSAEPEVRKKFPRYFKDKVSFVTEALPAYTQAFHEPHIEEPDSVEAEVLPKIGDANKSAVLDSIKETITPLSKRLGFIKPKHTPDEIPEVESVSPGDSNDIKKQQKISTDDKSKEESVKPQKLIRKLVLEVQGKFTKVKLASPTKGSVEEDSKIFGEVIKPKKEKRHFITPRKRKVSNKTPGKKDLKESPMRIDLDSRIQIMFGKIKQSPTKSDYDSPVRYHFKNFPPLRRTPSPFRSKSIYMYWHRETYYYRKHNPVPPESSVDPFHKRKIGIQIKRLQISEYNSKLSDEEDSDDASSKRKLPKNEENENLANTAKQEKVTVVDVVNPDSELELVTQSGALFSRQDISALINNNKSEFPSVPSQIKPNEQMLINLVIGKLLDDLRTTLKRQLTTDILDNALGKENKNKRTKLNV